MSTAAPKAICRYLLRHESCVFGWRCTFNHAVLPKRHLCCFWAEGDTCKYSRELCYNAHGESDQYCRFGFDCKHRRAGLCRLRHPPLALGSRVLVEVTYWDFSALTCHLAPASYNIAGTVLCSHVNGKSGNERFYCVHLDLPWLDVRSQDDPRPLLCDVHYSVLWRCENLAHAESPGICVLGASERKIVSLLD